MYPQITPRLLVALLLLVLFCPCTLSAQEWKARAISGVMHYRAAVLGDTTAKFDGCRVAQHLGAAEAAAAIAEPVRGILRPCGEAARAADRDEVRVDSLTAREGGGARVYLTVIRGEWVHREDFTLGHSSGPMMAVNEVRLWGAVQAYPRRPAASGAQTPPGLYR